MSGGKQSQAKPCPPDCRFRDSQGYCAYRQIMGRCRSLIEGAKHPGPDCACYEPADGQPKPRDLPRPARREAEVIRLYEEGNSDPEIARSIGCSPHAVFHWRRRTGRPANRRPGWQKGKARKEATQ